MHTTYVRAAARALAGDVSGRNGVLCPGPGHSREDRSLSVKFDLAAPDGFVVHSFAKDDAIACRDYVRERLGLEPFGQRQTPSHPPRIRAAPPPDDTVDRIGWARSIWRATARGKGTLAERYLVETRRLDLPATQVIRFPPRLKFTPTGEFLPAMCRRLSGCRHELARLPRQGALRRALSCIR